MRPRNDVLEDWLTIQTTQLAFPLRAAIIATTKELNYGMKFRSFWSRDCDSHAIKKMPRK
jgi:hypothetical protein